MKDMDVKDFNAWLNVVLVLWSACLTVVVWLRKPGAQAQESVKRIDDAMATQTAALTKTMTDQHHNLDLRLRAVETDMKHMPTSTELGDLEGTVKAIEERTIGLGEAVGTIRSTLGRIENFLLTTK